MLRSYRTSILPMESPLAPRVGKEAIARVVDEFYDLISLHPSLAGPFGRVQNWQSHKQHIAIFWWLALGGERLPQNTPNFDPVPKHFHSGFTPRLLCDWLDLFEQVLRRQLKANLADEWIDRARLIGERLTVADAAFRQHPDPEAAQ